MVGLLPEDQRPNCHYDLIDPQTDINYGKPPLGWRYDKNTMQKLIEDKRILWPESPEGRPRRKVFLNELSNPYTGYSSIIGRDIYTRHGTTDFENLLEIKSFDFPKPKNLLKELLSQSVKGNDIVLDFFAGSGTIAQAVMEFNQENEKKIQYICVQLPEPTKEKSEAYKAGYETIADIGKERIRRAARQIEDEQNGQLDLNGNGKLDLGFKAFKLDQSNFRVWDGTVEDEDALVEQLELHVDHIAEESSTESILYELLLKAGFPLTTKIEKRNMAGKEVFSIADGEVLLCLEQEVTSELIDALASANPSQVICLDAAFQRNDQLKVNAALTFKSLAEAKGTEMVFKTV